jgi:hypothetical protein
MSVYVIALNPGRRILFRWKCIDVNEARCIVRLLATSFSDSLLNITLTHRLDDAILHNKEAYDSVKHFTYETHPSYYIKRSY